jgi:hypothetical protein
MSEKQIPKEVKDFVFHLVDSVEQLDILLLLHGNAPHVYTNKDISDVLRSNPGSIDTRTQNLLRQGLLVSSEVGFRFNSENETVQKIVTQLAEIYKVQRYGVLEIIFSPLKKSRDFADAFKISNPKDPKGGRNG